MFEQQQVLDDPDRPAAQGVALLLAQVGDLLGDVGEVEVQIGAARGPAAQRLRLTLRPGVEVAIVEVGLGFVHQRTIRLCYSQGNGAA